MRGKEGREGEEGGKNKVKRYESRQSVKYDMNSCWEWPYIVN